MDIKKILNWRYSTKSFDPNKKISDNDFEQLKALLRFSPSSTNIQPWHFVIANTEAGKKRISKGAQGFFHFNEPKILNASHVVLFCSRTNADEEYMQHLLQQEDQDKRFPNAEIKQNVYNARNIFADIHRFDVKDFQHWMEKQVYLNIGNFLLGAATLGIDALPMEGVDLKALDEEFDLRKKEFTSVAVVALGYRDESDFNTPNKTPKSRLPEDEIFTLLN
ncbi:oxygen-insensitive NAD(P)H nitroreductase [Aquimarina litoralis]|uniref:oxygen-insensitive NAD(P)H nitroreductase n=1 Tax=Aquimarina litoralis TaxID=584605 RepID=UPI001C55D365|nr:oxygen-insensitive NAD(P)H nitroreductase [Aquimarina litoralis]MBW1297592.1 oxygen-insensitive NAD(P)H nitroreductase [Aquimarina litoralis]